MPSPNVIIIQNDAWVHFITWIFLFFISPDSISRVSLLSRGERRCCQCSCWHRKSFNSSFPLPQLSPLPPSLPVSYSIRPSFWHLPLVWWLALQIACCQGFKYSENKAVCELQGFSRRGLSRRPEYNLWNESHSEDTERGRQWKGREIRLTRICPRSSRSRKKGEQGEGRREAEFQPLISRAPVSASETWVGGGAGAAEHSFWDMALVLPDPTSRKVESSPW